MLQNVFLIAGLLMLFAGLVSWYNTSSFLAKCVITKGLIVSHDIQTNQNEEDNSTTSFPIFRFEIPQNETKFTVRSNVSGQMREGQEIEILYDPQNPQDAKINSLSHTWMIPIIVTSMGLFFSFLGILVRNSVTILTIIDYIILVFLVIIMIMIIGKYVKLKT